MIIKIIRHTGKFTTVCNAPFEDPRLSFKAKGVLIYLLTRPPDWEVRVEDMITRSTDRWTATYNALKELREYGYASLEVIREKGRIATKQWTIYEDPLNLDFPCQAEPCKGKRSHTKDLMNKRLTHDAAASGVRGFGFGVNGTSKSGHPKAAKLVSRFADFTIKNRLHVGRKGSTITGWQSSTLKEWERQCQDLLDQVDDYDLVKETMMWYIEHWKDDYVPKCHTMRTFCERFVDITSSKGRSVKEKTNGRYVKKKVWANGEQITVDEWVGR